MATSLLDIHSGTPSFPSLDKWSCPQCTFENSLENYPSCEMCGKTNLQSIEDFPFFDKPISIWGCPRCTLDNQIANEECQACGYRKSSTDDETVVLVNSKAVCNQPTKSIAVRERRHKDESHAEKVCQKIIAYCKKEKTNFIDDRFPPSERSIGPGSFKHIDKWLRISDSAPLSDEDRKSTWTVLSSPQPSDIQQGALGNCWLVAALALVSEQPRLLEHILLTKNVNREGVYLVRICHNGLWQTTIVDDYFPCTKHKHLVFTQAKRRQLYVPLIEKACAKVFGSYASLKSGNMSEGLQLLTGAPCDYIDLQPSTSPVDGDIVWAKVLSACESKLLIGASSGSSSVSPEEYARVNIHGNHAFSVLAAHVLEKSSFRYVLVRDPHARSHYTEDQINGSVFQQLRAVNPATRSTGAFWISWPRFLRYFSSITVSTYNSNHFDVRQPGKFTRSSTHSTATYQFQVAESSSINISLLYHRNSRKSHTSHTQSFVLCDIERSASGETVGKYKTMLICRRGAFTYWTGSLHAGSYVLIPFSTSFWRNNTDDRDYTIVIHSSIQLDLNVKYKPATYLADCLISASMKNSNPMREGKDVIFYATSKKLGMKVFIAENRSRTNFLGVDVDMRVAQNVRHSRHAHFPFSTHDSIPPCHRQIIFITEWIDKHNQSSRLEYMFTHKHSGRIPDAMPAIDRSQHDLHSPRAFTY